mmetsp:Transcript_41519/g.58428  ORF Transcript_41519/g.58428 Transcript_41519/m.58428 type:complete len:182 (+) Transcript_41519:18-563(+)
MDDFGNPGKANYYGLKPSESNFIQPDKKPLSSMSPMMVFQSPETENSLSTEDNNDNRISDDMKLLLVLGASGGPKIITAVLQVFIHFCWLGWPIFDSVAYPRIHDQLLYHSRLATAIEVCFLDEGPLLNVSETRRDALKRRGHRLLNIDYTGTVQAIGVDLEANTLSAACDIRKGGAPAGY